MINNEFDLQRFIDAQDAHYSQALDELNAGQKTLHWMWFIFPQMAGLAHSETSQRYAIQSLAEAQAYLLHPVLGDRLRLCTLACLKHREKTAEQIFGVEDSPKFHASLSLFASLEESLPVFDYTLQAFFEDKKDEATLALINE